MSGNRFGHTFSVTTFGESHGPALGLILDGVPPRLAFDLGYVQSQLDRRRPGQSRITTQRKEGDIAEVLSGVFEGKTTGAPLAMLIRNSDQRSTDYDNLREAYRPGHADFTYDMKYGIRDHRGGGRSSGRETACRVAAGAVAHFVLTQASALKGRLPVDVWAYTEQVGDIVAQDIRRELIEQNPVRTADPEVAQRMFDAVEQARKAGDSLGSIVTIVAENVPAGWGEPCFDKLDAEIARAMMGIGTVKGVEIGSGFRAVTMRGSQHNDTFVLRGGRIETETNHAGGILGGISTGQPIIVRCALKPPSSISQPQRTVDRQGQEVTLRVTGRHDPMIAPRFVPVAEAMLKLVLADAMLRQEALIAGGGEVPKG